MSLPGLVILFVLRENYWRSSGWIFQEILSSGRSRDKTTTTTTILRPFFRDYPGEPVPEENFWTLWCKGKLTEADSTD